MDTEPTMEPTNDPTNNDNPSNEPSNERTKDPEPIKEASKDDDLDALLDELLEKDEKESRNKAPSSLPPKRRTKPTKPPTGQSKTAVDTPTQSMAEYVRNTSAWDLLGGLLLATLKLIWLSLQIFGAAVLKIGELAICATTDEHCSFCAGFEEGVPVPIVVPEHSVPTQAQNCTTLSFKEWNP